ncbi:MAG: phage regulatory CII family protein [Candidatus Cryosericum sp.]
MEIQDFLKLTREGQRRLIKGLIFDTVPPGEVKETAAAAGLEDYTLYKMRDENRENHELLRPELLAIMDHRRDLRLLQWLAGLFGQEMVSKTRPGAPAGDLSRTIPQTIKNFGEYLLALTEALEDDSPGGAQLTFGEYAEIAAAADVVIRQITGLKLAAQLAQGGQRGGHA